MAPAQTADPCAWHALGMHFPKRKPALCYTREKCLLSKKVINPFLPCSLWKLNYGLFWSKRSLSQAVFGVWGMPSGIPRVVSCWVVFIQPPWKLRDPQRSQTCIPVVGGIFPYRFLSWTKLLRSVFLKSWTYIGDEPAAPTPENGQRATSVLVSCPLWRVLLLLSATEVFKCSCYGCWFGRSLLQFDDTFMEDSAHRPFGHEVKFKKFESNIQNRDGFDSRHVKSL